MADIPSGSSKSQVDRVAAETLIRTSVLALANGAAIGDIDEVIRRNASNVSHADVMAGRLNTSVLGDVISAVERARGNTAFNWHTASPEQIKAYQLANGLNLPGSGREGLGRLGREGGDGLSSRGGNQFAELRGGSSAETSTAPGSGYSMLTAANQNIAGFTQGQVASAANFLKDHGASREDINHDTRHMVHLREYQKPIGDFANRQREIDRRRGRGEDVGAEQDKLEKEKKSFRETLPEGKRKHFDELKVIRRHDKASVELDQKAALDSSQTIAEDYRRLGVAEKVEEHHKVDIDKVQSADAATGDALARLARHTQKVKVAEGNNESTEKGTPKQETTATSGSPASGQAKPTDKRQAMNTKSFNPTA